MRIENLLYGLGCVGMGLLNLIMIIIIYQLITDPPQYYGYQYNEKTSNHDCLDVYEGVTPTTKGLHLCDEIAVLWDSVWIKCEIINIKKNGMLTVKDKDKMIIWYYPTMYPPKVEQIDSLNNTIKKSRIIKK